LKDYRNDEALEELAWSLEASVGEFKLILARCNYIRLRSHLLNRLQSLTNIDIHVLNLKKTDKTLYTKIQGEVANKQPAALMVFYLESVKDLEQMLSATNQVREEFRKNFHFPVVLWVTDEVLLQLVRLASDFESWATTTEFAIATDELLKSLQEDSDALFSTALTSDTYSIGWQMGYLRRREITTALQDLLSRGQVLEPALKASVEFVRGQDAYLSNQIDKALVYYQESLTFWQGEEGQGGQKRSCTCSPPSSPLLRAGVILFYIGLCYFQQAERYRLKCRNYLEKSRGYFQQCLNIFTETNHPNLVAKFINPLGEVLQRLEVWDELQKLAQKSLNLQQLYGNPVRVAQAYGFLAEVASSKQRWGQSKQYAYKALHNIAKNKVNQQQRQGLYLLLLAQAEQNLGQLSRSLKHLQMAKDTGSQDNPHQYIRILQALRSLYWQQKQYLDAFRTKFEQRSVEQQYGFRAFIGAGRIQPQKQVKPAFTQVVETFADTFLQETVAPEITASGRGRDIEHLLERIGRPDYKLIVIHGYSGVGKSSLVQAGLVPALKQKTIGFQDVLPVAMGVYTNWERELASSLTVALEGKGILNNSKYHFLEANYKIPNSKLSLPNYPEYILEMLRQAEANNLRIVLIFDQFEELFFVYKSASQRREFFEFLGDCLNILGVKIILSLRQDYLHYLLECNYLPSMNIINHDILSKNVLYQLGNFTNADAKLLIKSLTEHSNFYLEPALIEQLVEDLAEKFGEVRPIELQVVGAQLQTENISTLLSYQERGPKEELVKRYLQEVVEDCGAENKQLAELVLYLLTDDKGTRPLKTRTQIERELQSLFLDSTAETSQLDLVLQIFVESSIVVVLPENPADRYQLVHDYLAAFIQKQQKPKLNELIIELSKERNQRKLSEDKLNLIYKWAFYAFVLSIFAGTILAVIIVKIAWQ
jgi:hypothetical protein